MNITIILKKNEYKQLDEIEYELLKHIRNKEK